MSYWLGQCAEEVLLESEVVLHTLRQEVRKSRQEVKTGGKKGHKLTYRFQLYVHINDHSPIGTQYGALIHRIKQVKG